MFTMRKIRGLIPKYFVKTKKLDIMHGYKYKHIYSFVFENTAMAKNLRKNRYVYRKQLTLEAHYIIQCHTKEE